MLRNHMTLAVSFKDPMLADRQMFCTSKTNIRNLALKITINILFGISKI